MSRPSRSIGDTRSFLCLRRLDQRTLLSTGSQAKREQGVIYSIENCHNQLANTPQLNGLGQMVRKSQTHRLVEGIR